MNLILPPYGRKESFNLVKDIIMSDGYNNLVSTLLFHLR